MNLHKNPLKTFKNVLYQYYLLTAALVLRSMRTFTQKILLVTILLKRAERHSVGLYRAYFGSVCSFAVWQLFQRTPRYPSVFERFSAFAIVFLISDAFAYSVNTQRFIFL